MRIRRRTSRCTLGENEMASATLAVVHDLEAYRRRREEAKLAAAQPRTAVMPVMWCYVWMPLPYAFAFNRPF